MPTAPSWGWTDDHPIVNVDWNDAQDYCNWAGVKLPTEAQWEKAARGTNGRQFPWGDTWEAGKCANSVGSNRLQSTAVVGSYPQGGSPYGALDMVGNVWEWCEDRDYANSEWCVLRGGSWFNYLKDNFRVSCRDSDAPACRDDYLGFRCASGL